MGIAMSGLRGSQPYPRVSGRERVVARPEAVDRQAVAPVQAPALPVEELNRSERIRRGLNVVLALVGIAVALPVMLVVAILIKLTSRGPVFYTQTRVGLDRRSDGPDATNHRRTMDIGGKPFEIYKFRTMHVNAEQASGAVWATKSDPRITSVGRFLRQYRLDELPQLLNVLKGEMNIVGPRPERPTIFAELRENIVEYPLRQRAKPGITGLA